jgi:UDP-N-acetylmuramoyl-tripeptide--D-alanyl-D-alanine ligase
VEAVGADLAAAGLALGDLGGLKGRGERHRIRLAGGGQLLLIDESYNANPASMTATLKSLGDERVDGRRIAVLGTMRELGEFSDAAHAGVAEPVLAAGVQLLILVGEETRPLEQALAGKVEVLRAAEPDKAAETLLRTVRAGDAVLVKASNGVGLARLVERVAGAR